MGCLLDRVTCVCGVDRLLDAYELVSCVSVPLNADGI
jgi:hypothetical protein